MKVLLFTIADSTAAHSGPGYSNFALTVARAPQLPSDFKFSIIALIRFDKEDLGDHKIHMTGMDSKRAPVIAPAEFALKIPGDFPENLYGGYDVQIVHEIEPRFKDYGRYAFEMRINGARKAEWLMDIMPAQASFPG